MQNSTCPLILPTSYQERYSEFAGTEVLNHKLRVYIAALAAGCHVQLAK